MFLETDHSDHRCCWSLMIYGSSESSRCFSTPPTRRRLPVTSTEMWPASQPDREPSGQRRDWGAQRSSRGGSSSSLWLIHWRALRMQGNTRLWFEEVSTRGRWCWFLVSVAFRLCHLLWLSLQPASMCCTHTHTDAVVSYRETAAQEKHSHVNVMYKIFSNGGENKHNTTLFELVASTSTLI